MKRICENCGKEFMDAWDELDSELEFEEKFPNEEREDGAIICDTCYPVVMAKLKDMGLI
jgi:hypothetical protein